MEVPGCFRCQDFQEPEVGNDQKSVHQRSCPKKNIVSRRLSFTIDSIKVLAIDVVNLQVGILRPTLRTSFIEPLNMSDFYTLECSGKHH